MTTVVYSAKSSPHTCTRTPMANPESKTCVVAAHKKLYAAYVKLHGKAPKKSDSPYVYPVFSIAVTGHGNDRSQISITVLEAKRSGNHVPGHQNGCAVSPLKRLWVYCLVYRAILGYLTIVLSS